MVSSNALVPQVIDITPEMFLLAKGEGNRLDDKGKENAIRQICTTLKLNPAGVPVQFLNLKGKLVPYLTRGATDQIRHRAGISTEILERSIQQGVYLVRVKVTLPDGRVDESTGAVHIEGLKGEDLANAFLKAETKAKRRATLSAVGLGIMDESEIPQDAERLPPPVLSKQPEPVKVAPRPMVKKAEPAPVVSAPAVKAPEPNQAAKAPEIPDGDDPFVGDAAPVLASKGQLAQIKALAPPGDWIKQMLARLGRKSGSEMTFDEADDVLASLKAERGIE
jgi:hypothetical protein